MALMNNNWDVAVAALRSLKDQWQNAPPTWGKSDDPCGSPWEGVNCSDSRVITLGLSTMGISGKLSGDIGELSELTSLDLSFNPGLTGSLTPRIGDLTKLTTLILAGCKFNGAIPSEIGKLKELSFLALNSNNFSGQIPASLGYLSKLYWLDLADNQLTGSIPISTRNSPGLDLLKNTKHFHFNKNQLSGELPEPLFSGDNVLIHVLFDGNQLSGPIPPTLGDVATLEVLRLDRNNFSGNVTSSLNNLTNLMELNLGHNQLSGSFPDFSSLVSLNYIDLSNNSFEPSEAPAWFSTLESLTTLISENGSLKGEVPKRMFSLPQIQQVKLKYNAFNGTLDLDQRINDNLQLIDLEDNRITALTVGSGYSNNLLLIGNPVCTTVEALEHSSYCQVRQQSAQAYSTSLANCRRKTCPPDQKMSPQSCDCAYPYEGTLYFRGPFFRDLSNDTIFHQLEMSLWVNLSLTPGSVSLQNPFFNVDDYLEVQLDLFPSSGDHFNRTEVQRLGHALSKQIYKPPPQFGPYYFLAEPYLFAGGGGNISKKIIAAVAVGGTFLVMLLVGIAMYAVWQKRRAERAIGMSKPFASWVPSGKDSGGAPQLKGARFFSYDEMKKATNNFSSSNEIGSGGYGKVCCPIT
ncbi:OLC1v1008010C1 [Oldenlandia corymbosa var. corymbosa]|uniref:non-specific serine/threonine protein kinase n=1 Tax=Oldenlandia corymbosa var. corymbosa TaxID=529605 RepID=A0AAV1DKT4_OLDCO|nr:OLC1v1008010C1 [Oldenlandia corymbosa var. corymbosa]